MSSSISWLDFSESDRRKMMEVVSSFKDQDTRDEMGLGQIRDGLADLFFPGTTTLQTRARYFLFVPWIYRYYEARQEPSARIERKVKKREITLIRNLKDANEDGVIGERSGANLNRFPSNIYWFGLGSWGIRRFRGTQYQYHRNLDYYYQLLRETPRSESAESVTDIHQNWDPNLPDLADGFPHKVTFDLTYEEADYLREKLLLSCTNSLSSFLVDHSTPVDSQDIQFPWLHPQVLGFPQDMQDWLLHARNFSETMQGSALLYNLMLAERRNSDALADLYREWLGQWHEELCQRSAVLLRWSLQDFWLLIARLRPVYESTKRFVSTWLEVLLGDGEITEPANDDDLRHIVFERETRLKRSRSRFLSKRHLDLWSGSAGTGQLDYRWRIGNRIARDIQIGLGKS